MSDDFTADLAAALAGVDYVDEVPQNNTRNGRAAGISRRAVLTPAAAIPAERVRWAWRPYLPLALSVVGGAPGLGKSAFTNAHVAAQLTRGKLEGDLFGRACDVIVVSGEDEWGGVIKPRLMAADADLDRVHRLEMKDDDGTALFTLPDDTKHIAAAVEELHTQGRTVGAVVIDPIGAFLHESVDSHKAASVRRALAPLAQLASDHALLVLVVAHLNKDESQRLLNRLAGSGAFGQAPRAVLAFARDPDDPEGEKGNRRVIVPVKSNWGRFAPSLAAHMEQHDYVTDDDEDADTVLLVVDGESDVTAEDLNGGPVDDTDSVREALIAALDAGERPSLEVKEEIAKRVGCSTRTVERRAGVMEDAGELVAERRGFPATAHWRLAVAPTDLSPSVATVETECSSGIRGPSSASGDTAGERSRLCRDSGGANGDGDAAWTPHSPNEDTPDWWPR